MKRREIRFETTERQRGNCWGDGFDVKLYVGGHPALDVTLHSQVFATLNHSPREIANVASGWLSHAQAQGWL